MRKGTGTKWENFSLAQGVGFPYGDSGEGNGLGRIDANYGGMTSKKRVQTIRIRIINAAVATVCASSADESFSSAEIEEMENERDNGEREMKREGGLRERSFERVVKLI